MSVSVLDTINAESLAFAKQFITQRKAALMKRKANATGDLIDSLEYEVTKQATNEAASLFLMFHEHGRYLDMKPTSFKYNRVGNDLIESIENWIDRKGLQKFVNVWLQKRNQSNTNQSIEKIRRSIAWGIAVNRTKGKFKRKVWWNRAKTAAISDLVNNIAAALPPTLSKDIVNSLK